MSKNISAVAVEIGNVAIICKDLRIFGYKSVHIDRVSITFLGYVGNELIFLIKV
jgi:hypothetical protein